MMKRRTLQQVRAEHQPEHHHNLYVVLLEPAFGRILHENVVYDHQES
ncbi:MAG: hypothetical protein ACLQU3_14820 [Limisphaerales bacterium]